MNKIKVKFVRINDCFLHGNDCNSASFASGRFSKHTIVDKTTLSLFHSISFYVQPRLVKSLEDY